MCRGGEKSRESSKRKLRKRLGRVKQRSAFTLLVTIRVVVVVACALSLHLGGDRTRSDPDVAPFAS
jgi:hypothetical protein